MQPRHGLAQQHANQLLLQHLIIRMGQQGCRDMAIAAAAIAMADAGCCGWSLQLQVQLRLQVCVCVLHLARDQPEAQYLLLIW